MQLIWIVLVGGLILFTYSSCSKEIHETDEYQYGYDDGYIDGYDDACRKFERNLPGAVYENNKPKYCR